MSHRLVILSSILSAAFVPSHSFAHKAHVHGTAKLIIGIEGKQGKINLEIPAASMYGFEHEARNAKEKKAIQTAIATFNENMSQMIILEDRLECSLQSQNIQAFVADKGAEEKHEHHSHHNKKQKTLTSIHGEFRAEINIKCKEDLENSKVSFAFKKYFPQIESLVIEGLSKSKQFSLKIHNDKGSLEL